MPTPHKMHAPHSDAHPQMALCDRNLAWGVLPTATPDAVERWGCRVDCLRCLALLAKQSRLEG